jgi:CheY-like chemotaxis protein
MTAETDNAAPGRRVEILIVDDEAEVAREIADGLSEEGHACSVVTSAAEAIDRVAAQPGRFGVVVTDIRMPGMDGVALARCLTAMTNWRNAPEFVMVTGHAVPAELAGALPGISLEVVRKPFRWTEFLEPVQRAHGRAVQRMAGQIAPDRL